VKPQATSASTEKSAATLARTSCVSVPTKNRRVHLFYCGVNAYVGISPNGGMGLHKGLGAGARGGPPRPCSIEAGLGSAYGPPLRELTGVPNSTLLALTLLLRAPQGCSLFAALTQPALTQYGRSSPGPSLGGRYPESRGGLTWSGPCPA